ncbi:MAG TPA: dihydrofolate reductase family protein [Puia sp.]|nr:dihydrofolate reductase family protein [Puia sp.]
MNTKVYIGTSLDGFIARMDGDFNWLSQFANDEATKAYEEFLSTIDAIVIGRRTFETVLTFSAWPYTKNVFVLSNAIKKAPDSLKGKVIILSMRPKDLLVHLAAMGIVNIYIDGGVVIQEFLKEDLVDELIIAKAPILIGSGIPLFGYIQNDLQFAHTKTEIQSNGLARSYYKRIRK